ncbi:MAG TPA: mechanosensitive ion channel domain-containing protein [Candidatus Limnocylindria bacterium]
MEQIPQQLTQWLQDNALAILGWGVLAFVVVRFARPIIHRILLRVMTVPDANLEGPARAAEVTKRVDTLEDVLSRLVKYAVVIAIVIVAFSLFDLWALLAGVGILAAGLTLAGQPIVLDYLTGMLLLFEGPFYIGDVVTINGVQGTVEEIGLRRTTVRDVSGTVHSIANGEMRITSNMTRYYAHAVVDIVGVPAADVEKAIEVMNAVGVEIAADEEWKDSFLETPTYRSTIAFTDLGVTLRMSGRVVPSDRWRVASEMRRRLSLGLSKAGVAPNHRLLSPMPTDAQAGGTGAPPSPMA